MAKKNIPIYNEELDIRLLLHIITIVLKYIILIFIIAAISCYLIIRYIQPVYEAQSILQIEAEDKMQEFLGIGKQPEDNLSQKIELIKSKIFLERVFSNLPLDVSYFNEGKILLHELYTSSPFVFKYTNLSTNIYDEPIRVSFIDQNNFIVEYTINKDKKNEEKRITKVKPGKREYLPEMEFTIEYADKSNISSNIESLKGQKHYIIYINDPNTIYYDYINNINISVHSQVAKTILISVKDKNPSRSTDIANEIASEFQKFDIEKKTQSVSNTLLYINDQLDVIGTELKNYEDSIRIFKRQHNLDTVFDIAKSDFKKENKIEIIQQKLLELNNEREILNSFSEEIKRKTQNPFILDFILSGSKYYSFLKNMLATHEELLTKKEELSRKVKDNSTFIESLNKRVGKQQEIIFATVDTIMRYIDYQQGILKKELARHTGQIIDKETGTGADESYNIFELRRFEQIHSINKNFYQLLVDKKVDYLIMKAGFVSDYIILQKSLIPASPIYPSKKKIFLYAITIAIFLSLSIIVLRYLFFNKIINVAEINKYIDVPVIGVIPVFSKKVSLDQLIVEKHPKSVIAEAFRAIRSNLQFIDQEKGPKVITVTSTISGEGKTFVAFNLAGVLAIAGFKIIIIDVDLRKPSLHKLFKIRNQVGLSSYLGGMASIDEIIQNIDFHNINIITAGPAPPNPAELINSTQMEKLIEELKTKFDFIVLDNPPIGLVSDPLKTLQLADYPIFVIRANFTKRPFLLLPDKIYTNYNINKLSIILNAYDNTVSTYGKSRDIYYSYGYGYGSYGLKYGYGKYYQQTSKAYYADDIGVRENYWQKFKKSFFAKKTVSDKDSEA